MLQVRRHSLDNKLNSRINQKEIGSETPGDIKLMDKYTQSANSSAKSLKLSGATHQTSIKEQLKPKPSKSKNNKCNCEDNSSAQKSPPKKRANCEPSSMPVETNSESTEVKVKELKPEHEELKQQIFAGIRLMLDPIKEDIEQIKLDQRGYESNTQNLSGCKIKQQIIKNEEKQKKLENKNKCPRRPTTSEKYHLPRDN